jgi:hypothetical protein
MTALELAYQFGAWSAVVCFIVTYTAARFVSKHSTLYMALSLVAVSWALIAAVGSSRLDALQSKTNVNVALSDRAFDVVSFLLVLTGALMTKAEPQKYRLQSVQRWMQIAGLLLVSCLVLPDRAMLMPAIFQEWLNTPTKFQLFFGEILGTLGYLSLVLGVYALVGWRWALSFLPVVTVYESLSLWRTREIWGVAERSFVDPELAYSFVVLRIMFTLFICVVVLMYTRRPMQERLELQTEVSVVGHR